MGDEEFIIFLYFPNCDPSSKVTDVYLTPQKGPSGHCLLSTNLALDFSQTMGFACLGVLLFFFFKLSHAFPECDSHMISPLHNAWCSPNPTTSLLFNFFSNCCFFSSPSQHHFFFFFFSYSQTSVHKQIGLTTRLQAKMQRCTCVYFHMISSY